MHKNKISLLIAYVKLLIRLRKWLSQYKKPDGSIGYEYYTYSKYYNLNIGDKIIQKENGKIKIKRKKEQA